MCIAPGFGRYIGERYSKESRVMKGQGMISMHFTFTRFETAPGNHLPQNVCVCGSVVSV